jgi:hypothetical protein
VSQFSGSTFGRYTRFWLYLVGVIQLALAAFFIIGLGGIPFAGPGMLLTGAILGAVGIGLVVAGVVVGRRAAAVERIVQTGLAGRATVTGVTQTGMYLNNQPQLGLDLMVELPGRAPYAAKHKSFVPLILLSRVGPGMVLPVKVDPADPQRVVVDWQASAPAQPMTFGQPMQPMAAAGAGAFGGTVDESMAQVQAALASSGAAAPATFASPEQANYTLEQLREHLRQNGLEGHARIDELTDTGQIVGNERLYTMSLTLELPGQAPERLPTSAAMVPIAQMHKVRLGARIPVRVAAENHNLTMFEWD